MTNYVPFSSIGETLPAAETLPTWSTTPGEEQIYDLPALHSWLQAGAPDGFGVYADRGQRGNNWVQATAANQPPLLTNWHGLTGLSAFNFDGVTAFNAAGSFILPPGEITVAAVFDLNASTSTGDGNRRTLLTSQMAPANQFGFCQQNRKPTLYTTGLASTCQLPSALSTNTTHLVIHVWSAADQELAISVDGGAWTSMSLAGIVNQNALRDTTCMIGGGNGANGSTTYMPWSGAIAEVLVFSGSLKNAAEAGALALVVATLKAKYAIS